MIDIQTTSSKNGKIPRPFDINLFASSRSLQQRCSTPLRDVHNCLLRQVVITSHENFKPPIRLRTTWSIQNPAVASFAGFRRPLLSRISRIDETAGLGCFWNIEPAKSTSHSIWLFLNMHSGQGGSRRNLKHKFVAWGRRADVAASLKARPPRLEEPTISCGGADGLTAVSYCVGSSTRVRGRLSPSKRRRFTRMMVGVAL